MPEASYDQQQGADGTAGGIEHADSTGSAADQPHLHSRNDPLIPVFFILLAIVVGQVLLFFWKRRSPKSYHRVTLLLLWIFPFVVACAGVYWRFLAVWVLFSITTCFHLYVAMKGNVINDHSLPRRVYGWFSAVYRVSYGMSVVGYFLVMVEVFNLTPVEIGVASYWGTMLLFYGLYFGVLGRDSAELSAHSMAVRMGLLVQDGIPLRSLPPNQCGVCGEKWARGGVQGAFGGAGIGSSASGPPVTGTGEDTLTLNCGHAFHPACIRGWALLGKKDTCPFCSEKVDLHALVKSHPWQAENTLWARLLDLVRFLVAWSPVLSLGGVLAGRIVAAM